MESGLFMYLIGAAFFIAIISKGKNTETLIEQIIASILIATWPVTVIVALAWSINKKTRK